MLPTAADYEWFTQSDEIAIAENYCLTLLKGISTEELVRRIGGTVERAFPSLHELWDTEAERATSPVVAITTIGDWVFMAESGSLVGGSTSTAIPLSMHAVLVSHTQSVDLDTSFLYIVDGDVRLSFQPMHPTMREGSGSDEFMEELRSAGFDLVEESATGRRNDHGGAAFALAEIITGVHLTAETLDSSTYSYVTIGAT
jgi:hypothetical protein